VAPVSFVLRVALLARAVQIASRRAAFTFSGVKGTERKRTPAASNTAFEIARGTTAADGSPAPQGAPPDD
jgi:hypothetical protein